MAHREFCTVFHGLGSKANLMFRQKVVRIALLAMPCSLALLGGCGDLLGEGLGGTLDISSLLTSLLSGTGMST